MLQFSTKTPTVVTKSLVSSLQRLTFDVTKTHKRWKIGLPIFLIYTTGLYMCYRQSILQWTWHHMKLLTARFRVSQFWWSTTSLKNYDYVLYSARHFGSRHRPGARIEYRRSTLVIQSTPCRHMFVWFTTYEHTEFSEWPVRGGISSIFYTFYTL